MRCGTVLLAAVAWIALSRAGLAQPVCRTLEPPQTGSDRGGQLGCSVAAGQEGRTLAAGANLADERQRGIEDAGSVTLVEAGVRLPELFASNAARGDEFGFALAIEGETLAVGARFGDTPGVQDAGAVYVFRRGEGDWQESARITAPDAASGAQFGAAVALHNGFLAVGAPLNSGRGTASGAVYVFAREGEGWTLQDKLVSSRTAPFDNFGTALALDGRTLVVGAPFADGERGGEGTVHVFALAKSRWTEVRTLSAAEAAAGDQLGFAVALAGDTLAAGARRDDHGGHTDAGSVVIFEREGEEWRERPRLTAGAGARSGDLFGGAVALSGDRLLVGASLADGANGAAFVFERQGGDWILLDRVSPSRGAGGRFGFSVALSGTTAVAGAFAAEGGAGAVSVVSCRPEPPLTLDIRLKGDTGTIRQGQKVAYEVDIRNAPAGTRVTFAPSQQLGPVAWCRGQGCTPVPRPLGEVLVQGGDAVYTVESRVRFRTEGRVGLEVRVMPPAGTGAQQRDAATSLILLPDLTCQTAPDPVSVAVGDRFVTTFLVANQGDAPATGLVLPSLVPDLFTLVAGGPCNTFPCPLGALGPGRSLPPLELTLEVPEDYAGPALVEMISIVQARELESGEEENNQCKTRVQISGIQHPIPALGVPGLLALVALLAAVALRKLR